MFETGFVGVRGVKFILHRRPNLPDRLTGIRPNPNLIFGGYYVDNTQNSEYNAWQSSIRKRFSHNVTFEGHYTWGKGLGITGSDIGAYYGSDNDQVNIQEFNNPRADRGPNQGDASSPLCRRLGLHCCRASRSRTRLLTTRARRLGSRGDSQRAHGRPADHHRNLRLELALPSGLCRRRRPSSTTGSRPIPPDASSAARCSVQYLNRAAFALVPVDPEFAHRDPARQSRQRRGPRAGKLDDRSESQPELPLHGARQASGPRGHVQRDEPREPERPVHRASTAQPSARSTAPAGCASFS